MWCETADNRSVFPVLINLWEVRFKCMWEMVWCLCIYIYKHSLLSFPPSVSSSFLPSFLLSFLPLFLLPSVLLLSTENQIIAQKLIDVSVSSFLEISSPGIWNQWKEWVPAPRAPDRGPVDLTLLPIPGSAFSHPARLFTKHLYAADVGRLLRLSPLCTLSNTKVTPWERWGRRDLSVEGLPRGKM